MTTPTYSRPAFRAWLLTLPQDEPFCGDRRCPIGVFTGDSNANAVILDSNLVWHIDSLPSVRAAIIDRGWARVTPREVIALIDELEEAA